jgi:hypothetical protein
MAGVRSFVEPRLGVKLDFDTIVGGFRQEYPQYLGWVTPEREPGLRCCFEAVEDLDGVELALRSAEVPILLWDGRKDPHHHGSRDLAASLPRADFLETAGDHAAAFYIYGSEAIPGLRNFLDRTRTA